MKKTGKHGGRREGAGRKRRPELITYSVRLTAEQATLLKLWGGGSISAGVRWLISAAEMFVTRRE